MEKSYRIGQGFDVHQLVEGRDLFLCGVKIPYHLGLLGHSDADVALHALCDALLGAAHLGDIGVHFPDTDPEYKGVDSRILLRKVKELIADQGFSVENVDVTIVAQTPKVGPYRQEMINNIAQDLDLSEDRISLKATTTEHLGFTGRSEGIASIAVALIYKKEE